MCESCNFAFRNWDEASCAMWAMDKNLDASLSLSGLPTRDSCAAKFLSTQLSCSVSGVQGFFRPGRAATRSQLDLFLCIGAMVLFVSGSCMALPLRKKQFMEFQGSWNPVAFRKQLHLVRGICSISWPIWVCHCAPPEPSLTNHRPFSHLQCFNSHPKKRCVNRPPVYTPH